MNRFEYIVHVPVDLRGDINTRVHCNNGFSIAVYADACAFCTPQNDVGPYVAVELAFPEMANHNDFPSKCDMPTEFDRYRNGTSYRNVPVGMVRNMLFKNGGVYIK